MRGEKAQDRRKASVCARHMAEVVRILNAHSETESKWVRLEKYQRHESSASRNTCVSNLRRNRYQPTFWHSKWAPTVKNIPNRKTY